MLRRCPLYFKMQFLGDGYDDEAVVPGGFPPAGPTSTVTWDGCGGSARDRTSRLTSSVDSALRLHRRYGAGGAILREQDAFGYQGGLEPSLQQISC